MHMRQVAHHVYVKELLEGSYEEREGWEPNILHTGRGDLSRCNVVGVLLSLGGEQVLDDGTGQVSLRAFDPVPGLDKASSGEVVQVVGRPRVYQQRSYIIPESVRSVGPDWARVRKAELGEPKAFVAPERPAPKKEPEPQFDNKAEFLISIIGGLDEGEGADVQDVVKKSGLGKDADRIMEQLLLDGEVFEIRPGVVKVL